MSRTVDTIRKQLAATHLDYPHSRAVHDVELLLGEIRKLHGVLMQISNDCDFALGQVNDIDVMDSALRQINRTIEEVLENTD